MPGPSYRRHADGVPDGELRFVGLHRTQAQKEGDAAMSRLDRTVLDYFDQEYPGQYDHEENTVTQEIGEGEIQATLAWFDEGEPALIIVYAHLADVPALSDSQQPLAIRLANVLNADILVGACRVGEDGEVMVRHSYYVADGTLGFDQIAANYSGPVNDAIRFYPAFLAIAGGADFEAALGAVLPDED